MTWINSSLDWQVSPIIKSACQLSARYHEGIFEGGVARLSWIPAAQWGLGSILLCLLWAVYVTGQMHHSAESAAYR